LDVAKETLLKARIALLISLLCLLLPSLSPALQMQLPEDPEILALLRSKIKGRDDFFEKKVKRLGDKAIDLEMFVATEAETKDAAIILADLPRLPSWALTNINNRPGGGNYLMKLTRMEYTPTGPGTYAVEFVLDLPLFKKTLYSNFKMSTKQNGDVTTMVGEMVPDPNSHVEWSEAVLKVFPAEKKPHRAWIYVKGRMKIRNWLLYEAMPEALLNRESGERTQIFIDNYLREEDRLHARAPSHLKRRAALDEAAPAPR
jgi:hypothetical protein